MACKTSFKIRKVSNDDHHFCILLNFLHIPQVDVLDASIMHFDPLSVRILRCIRRHIGWIIIFAFLNQLIKSSLHHSIVEKELENGPGHLETKDGVNERAPSPINVMLWPRPKHGLDILHVWRNTLTHEEFTQVLVLEEVLHNCKVNKKLLGHRHACQQ